MRKLLEKHREESPKIPLIGGHRGCLCDKVENTIPAMAEGIMRGASYLEIDIQLTKDRIPVVYHDIDLSQKTPLHGFVHQFTYSEIRECWPVETLEDVMNWGKKNDVYFALELKGMPAYTFKYNMALMPLMIDIINGAGMKDNVEAFGIDYRLLREIKRLDKSFDIGLIVPFVPSDPVSLMKEYDAMIYLAYSYMIDAETAERLMSNGYYVSGAILSDEKYIRHAYDLSLDMFEHDEPWKAAALIRSFQSSAS